MAGSAPIIQALDGVGQVYPVEKMDAHVRGVRHVAVSAFVFAKGDLLLQRRAMGKYHCGGQWANTCCSHPGWGESPAACVSRRVKEELGLDCPFEPAGVLDYEAAVGSGLVENEHVHLFTAEVDRDDVAIAPDPGEVMEIRWMPVLELLRDAATYPERYTPWLRLYLQRAAPLTERAA